MQRSPRSSGCSALPFLLFLCYFARPIIRAAPLPLLALCFCAFLVNFGEYIFFSIGGLGMTIWLYFAVTHRSSVEREQSFLGFGMSGERRMKMR